MLIDATIDIKRVANLDAILTNNLRFTYCYDKSHDLEFSSLIKKIPLCETIDNRVQMGRWMKCVMQPFEV